LKRQTGLGQQLILTINITDGLVHIQSLSISKIGNAMLCTTGLQVVSNRTNFTGKRPGPQSDINNPLTPLPEHATIKPVLEILNDDEDIMTIVSPFAKPDPDLPVKIGAPAVARPTKEESKLFRPKPRAYSTQLVHAKIIAGNG
jgi:hypothetical protein